MNAPSTLVTGAQPVSTRTLLRLALYYGIAGFGGGYSVLSQLRRELVEERRWLSAEDFLVLAELSKSLPGTPATTLLALVGQRVGGVRGGAIAAIAFLIPSTLLMIAFGAAYSVMRKATSLGLFFDGMNAAMVGVVAATTIDLAKSALRSRIDIIAAIGCGALLATRIVTEPILAGGAIAFGVARGVARGSKRSKTSDAPPKSERLHSIAPVVLLIGSGAGAIAALVRIFVPIGIMTFGGGLAMVPAIEHTVVIEQHWLSPKTFADAVALGQITPGPVAICATFVGYQIGGVVGALVATAAMFGPAIALALAVGHSIERFRESALVESALRALAPAVIGMLIAATFSLGRAAIDDKLDIAIALVALGLVWRWRLSPLWPLVGGGVIHLVASMAGLRV